MLIFIVVYIVTELLGEDLLKLFIENAKIVKPNIKIPKYSVLLKLIIEILAKSHSKL
jgi:hypothetical protein